MKPIPDTWSTWGSIPDFKDKDNYLGACFWRAFNPQRTYVISLNWSPETDPAGTYLCQVTTAKMWEVVSELRSLSPKDLFNFIKEMADKYG